jgi:hypothetical protein
MRFFLGLFIILECSIAAKCGTIDEQPSGLDGAEIIWSTPTNNWPSALWVYKVIPQGFSPAVVSNLLALGSFTVSDRTNMLGEAPFKDKTILYFRNEDQSKHLGIFPALGWIDYNDRKAKSASQLESLTGVPDQEETTRLGLKYLRLAGIDISELAIKPGTCDLDLHWERETLEYTDPKTKSSVKVTNLFGVYFNRRIDNINVGGLGLWGGAKVSFGNNAKVVDLQICWRNLKPYQLRDFPSPQQITKWVRSGKIALHSIQDGNTIRPLTSHIKKLTITKATPLYDGKYQDEPMDFVCPYARFEAIAEDGSQTIAVWFISPILTPATP